MLSTGRGAVAVEEKRRSSAMHPRGLRTHAPKSVWKTQRVRGQNDVRFFSLSLAPANCSSWLHGVGIVHSTSMRDTTSTPRRSSMSVPSTVVFAAASAASSDGAAETASRCATVRRSRIWRHSSTLKCILTKPIRSRSVLKVRYVRLTSSSMRSSAMGVLAVHTVVTSRSLSPVESSATRVRRGSTCGGGTALRAPLPVPPRGPPVVASKDFGAVCCCWGSVGCIGAAGWWYGVLKAALPGAGTCSGTACGCCGCGAYVFGFAAHMAGTG
mmetsp:Transcript_11299/g.35115  ORF Transcript_11299/g.35115 Transcript_11299/m.35115 type:complete len:270 (-) Transcript_11299:480-1289(-)